MPYIRYDGPLRPRPSLDREVAWINFLALLGECTQEEQLGLLCDLACWALQARDDELDSLRFHKLTVERAMALEFSEPDT